MTEIDDKSLSLWHNLYERWLVSATKIIKVDTFSEDTDISELLDIENEISTCINALIIVGIELPKAMEDFKPFLEVIMKYVQSFPIMLACPPKVVPSVKLVFVENERNRAYDTQTVHS